MQKDDVIYRQAAISIVEFECGEWEGLAQTIVNGIKKLPSAQPEINCSEIPNNSDLIDRQAVKDIMFNIRTNRYNNDKHFAELCLEEFDALPSAQSEPRTGWDAISRPVAIEEVCNMMRECFGADDEMLDALETTLNELTAIYPDRKTGRWIYGEDDVAMCDGYHCSECGFFVPWDYKHKFIDFIKDYNFCPSCGSYNGEGR